MTHFKSPYLNVGLFIFGFVLTFVYPVGGIIALIAFILGALGLLFTYGEKVRDSITRKIKG